MAGRNKDTYQAKPGKNYLLAIGIDKYQHWPALYNAVKDAREFTEVLSQQYQFPKEHIKALFDEAATESNIYVALREMKNLLLPNDNLIVYYSGHGYYDTDFDEGFWVPYNATQGDESAYISNANILNRVGKLETQHTLLIVDSCFSGSLFENNRSAILDEHFKSRRILTSGRNETVSDGKKGGNSPFSTGLLTYLRKNTAPRLDTTTLFQYVKNHVHINAEQKPRDGRIKGDQSGEFVFYLKRDENTVWKDVCATNSVDEYRNYILGFPDGQYLTVAARKIDELEESDVWKSTQINDNELAYEDYIHRYTPHGKYLSEAREQLGKLKIERAERQKAQEEMADRKHQREGLRQKYDAVVKEAEAFFEKKQLTEARAKYREALKQHLPNFIPNQQYLEEQINFCQTNLAFLRHYENGKTALEADNFRLALEYFEEALQVNGNPKVEKLVAFCKQQLQPNSSGQRGASARTFQQQTAQPKSGKSGLWWVGVSLGGGLLLLFLIGLFVPDEDVIIPDPPPIDQQTIYEGQKGNDYPPQKGGSKHTKSAARSTYDYLLGSWTLQSVEIIRDGYAYNAIDEDPSLAGLIGVRFIFDENGQVNIPGDGYYYYYLDGNQLTITGSNTGQIVAINGYEMVYQFYFSNTFGTHLLQYTLRK